ncbi:disintegrin and metalloproteinase domain-containing protein 10-like [Centruroides vittatus]|uniref:disintegrin and metalloproteinase domain-containing protein 10-like n=1 Tax=Centruroides vittatus TaxID=120091 RepID=UPI00350FD2E8
MDILIFALLIIFSKFCQNKHFLDLVQKYEVVHLRVMNYVHRNSLRLNHTTRVYFNAFGKNFSLLLRPDENFVPKDLDVSIKKNNETYIESIDDITRELLYQGSVVDAEGSYVFGYFVDGAFAGTIKFQDETFYAEPANKHLGDVSDGKKIVVYREKDVRYPCSKLENEICNIQKDEIESIGPHHSSRNSWKSSERGKICDLELISDHTYFWEMNGDLKLVIKSMFYHVKAADAIFSNTDFDGDGKPDGVRFYIKKITIFQDSNVMDYPMREVTNSSYQFLDDLSLYIQLRCLAICFTHREFAENVVGMAYRAGKGLNSTGGICQAPLLLEDYRWHSLNVAFISSFGPKRRLPDKIINHALTHELGHSFGSPHDNSFDPVCSPGYLNGNYIMSEFTNDGSLPNNVLFSPCSRASIYDVMKTKSFCMLNSVGTFCGNGIVESGEECDCGTNSTCDYIDPCCVPMNGESVDKQCTVRRSRGYTCSPRGAACCNSSCQFVPKGPRKICNSDNPCDRDSFCTGNSEFCSPVSHVPDGTPCRGTYFTCSSGVCNVTICHVHHLKTCDCPNGSGKECHICCVEEKKNACKSAAELGFYTPSGKLYLKPTGVHCTPRGVRVCDHLGSCVARYRSNHVAKITILVLIKKYWLHLSSSILLLICILYIIWRILYPVKSKIVSNVKLTSVRRTESNNGPHIINDK